MSFPIHVHLVCSLVAGDVEGNIKQLFTRIEGILKKSGPFEVHQISLIIHALGTSNYQYKAISPSDAALCGVVLC